MKIMPVSALFFLFCTHYTYLVLGVDDMNKLFYKNNVKDVGTGNTKNDTKDEIKNDNNRENVIIENYNQIYLNNNNNKDNIFLINIFGEIEGHECSQNMKSTKYEMLIPLLAYIENNKKIDGILVLINTVGGDVESGLAIAEMLSSCSKPKVCLVLGGGHSIGVPLAVSGDKTFIAPSATMVVHPIRVNGTVLGVRQNYEYIERMQDRIIEFTARHSNVSKEKLKTVMFNTTELTKDIGSVLIGTQAVECGIIDKVGGISDAMNCLYDLINKRKNSKIEPYEHLY